MKFIYGNNCSNIGHDKNCNIIVNDNGFNENYIQIFILKYIDSTETQTIIRETEDQEIKFKDKGDGYYTLCKLTISKSKSKYYYYKDGKFYHNVQEVTLKEILNVNPEVSGITPEYIYYFSTCHLKKCFINICQEIFKAQTSICNKPVSDGSLSYKRDLLWAALSVIEYLVEMCQMEEAQRILKEIAGCNGLCPEALDNTSNNSGCGCGS